MCHMGDSWGKWIGFGGIWMIVLMVVMGGWWMGFGSIWMIIPMAAIVWAILRVGKRGGEQLEPRGPVESSPQEILK